MTENVKKVLKSFKSKPYMVRMGAESLAKRIKVTAGEVREARRLFHSTPAKRKAKILILDIETSPMKAWVWRRWKENIYLDQTIQEWFIISWSGKWVGDNEVFGYVLTPEEINNENDRRILIKLYEALNKADIVVAHNGKRFDIPKINTRFILNGLSPTSPYIQIDTLEVAKKQFGFSSNSLDALATFFGFDNKDPHDFMLWRKCLEGDRDSLERLLNYNKKDVEILERVYFKLRPWIKNHPNVNIIGSSDTKVCTHCGSANIEIREGSYNTQHYKYPIYRCKDCGAVFRSKVRISERQYETSI